MTTRVLSKYDRVVQHKSNRAVLCERAAFTVIPLSILATLYYLHPTFTTRPSGIIAVLGGAVIILLYRYVAQRRMVQALHRGVLRAQEGELQLVTFGRITDPALQRFAADYNLLVGNLRSMFREIEGCQNRTIAERNRNEAILHSLPGALICVGSDGRITHSNHQAELLFAAPRAVLVGQNLFSILDLDEEGIELLRDALLYERQVVNKEIVLHLAKTTRYFTLNMASFKSPDPSEIGAAVVVQDITDYKRLQESVYNTEKLAAIGQLAAGVAHELNTPLGNIIGYARLIQEAYQDRGELDDYTRIISTEAKRCSRIVENLLSYARHDRCRLEICDLNKLIRDVVETISNCQGRRYDVAISMELAGEEAQVEGEEGQIEIVLVNLLMNAIQATKDSGNQACVTIRTRGGSLGPVVMEVEDNGCGVRDELQNRIFDPFFTTKDVGEGTGLGLAISQMMVAKMGGSLKYDASYKKGARFVMKLPRA